MRRGQPASGQSSPQGSLQVSAASKPTLNHPTRLLSCTQGGSQGPQPNTTGVPKGPQGCPLPEGLCSACPPGCGEHNPHCPGLAFLEGDKIPGSERVFCVNRHWHRECWVPAPPPSSA